MGKLCAGYCASYRPARPSALSTFLWRQSAKTTNSACPIETHLAPNLFNPSVFPIWVHDVISLPSSSVPLSSPSAFTTSIAAPHIQYQWANMIALLPRFCSIVPATSCLVRLITYWVAFPYKGNLQGLCHSTFICWENRGQVSYGGRELLLLLLI